MQKPWHFEVNGTSPHTFVVEKTSQLVMLSATAVIPAARASAPMHGDNLALVPGASNRLLLRAQVILPPIDSSYDAYACETPEVILATFKPEGPQPAQLRFMVRPGSTIRLSLAATGLVSVEWLAQVAVSMTGCLLEGLPRPSHWRPVIRNKWFLVKPTVRTVSLLHPPRGQHGPLRQRRAGECIEVRCVSMGDHSVRWTNGAESLLQELTPYRKTFTPARVERVVRVRRFPHRNADVIGEVPFGTAKVAIGQAIDETHKDLYVHWEDGGWSRVQGSEGSFLVEHRLTSCTVFDTPRLFTSAKDNMGVRVRTLPSLSATQLDSMVANEVREACALHVDDEGNQFVEWKSGGFSCVANHVGQYLVEMIPVNQTLRLPPRRASRYPSSPEITPLERGSSSNKRRRETGTESSSDDSDDDVEQLGKRPRSAADVGVSPGLVPEALRQKVAKGSVALADLPPVALNGVGGESSNDDDSESGSSDEVDSDNDDVDWSDEEEFSSDDYDEDALDESDDGF